MYCVCVMFHILYSNVRNLYQFERSFCAGPGKEIYAVGGSGAKGSDGSEEKLYCQVKRKHLFRISSVCMELSYVVLLYVCCVSVCLSVYLFVCAHVHLSVVHLSVCQVAIERKETLFIDDPSQFPGLEMNEDYVKYGYGYYLGAPWAVGDTRGEVE